MTAEGSALLLVDVQQRLVPAIHDGAAVVAATGRLAEAARAGPARPTAPGAAGGRRGAEIVTSEMVLFEWLGDSTHPRFREVHALIR